MQQLVAFQQSLKWTFRGLFNMGVPCYRLRCPACLSETPSSKSSSSVLAKERLTKAPGKRARFRCREKAHDASRHCGQNHAAKWGEREVAVEANHLEMSFHGVEALCEPRAPGVNSPAKTSCPQTPQSSTHSDMNHSVGSGKQQ